MNKVQPGKFRRKPFDVEAIQVTEQNMQDVARWCKGRILTQDPSGLSYISVRVLRPQNDRQTQAFIGDWVVVASGKFKVYTDGAFNNVFEEVPNGWVIASDGGRLVEIHDDSDYGRHLDPDGFPVKKENAAVRILGDDRNFFVGPNCD